jgi:hypothetical protein
MSSSLIVMSLFDNHGDDEFSLTCGLWRIRSSRIMEHLIGGLLLWRIVANAEYWQLMSTEISFHKQRRFVRGGQRLIH